jgi:hypothetical protein
MKRQGRESRRRSTCAIGVVAETPREDRDHVTGTKSTRFPPTFLFLISVEFKPLSPRRPKEVPVGERDEGSAE